MSNKDKGKVVLVHIDIQRDFMPGAELPKFAGPVMILPDLHISMFQFPGGGERDAALLAALARAYSEPPMPPRTHASFAEPGEVLFTAMKAPADDFDIWPRHCVMGTRES